MCAPQLTLNKQRPCIEPKTQIEKFEIADSSKVAKKKNTKKQNNNKNKKSQNENNNNNNNNNGNNNTNDKKQNKKNKKNNTKKAKKSKNQRLTQQQQKKAKEESEQEISLEEQGRYLALDCEMVGVGPGGYESALARVSIVDYNNAVLFDTYVKVSEPVTDYRTFVSGIREEHLQSDLAMDFAQCQSIVKKLLQGKILVGHALKNDMTVLDLEHPWYNCRDTAKYEPFMKKDKNTNLLRPRKLKDLTETKLDRIIQIAGQEHCPVEDAIAALDLFKKARVKWEKAMAYKMNRTTTISSEYVME